MKKPILLAILDGLGNNPNPRANAVLAAKTPVLDMLRANWPQTEIVTCGERVGLPEGQMGNSEVGHLNLGAGRVVEQELTRLQRAAREHSFHLLPEFRNLCDKVVRNNSALHFIGLTSQGGVHSHISQLQALLDEAVALGVRTLYVHAITDGRDRPPNETINELPPLLTHCTNLECSNPGVTAKIISVVGRYWAMDRDNRWDRTLKAYELFTEGRGEKVSDILSAIKKQHTNGVTDEFLEPTALSLVDLNPTHTERAYSINNNDGVLLWNFRADRMRQLSSLFIDLSVDITNFSPPNEIGAILSQRKSTPRGLKIATMTEYSADIALPKLITQTQVRDHLGEVIAEAGLRQLRIAETEKYAHVTYFFSGGAEKVLPGEERVLVPSPREVPTYDLKPEMSAAEVADALIERLKQKLDDVVILNFANCDMVGHTGNFGAAVKAVEAVDYALGRILSQLELQGGSAIVTADHGNAEQMEDYVTGEPHTFHTTYPVPLFLFGERFKSVKLRLGGALCDVAPTLLTMLGLAIPSEMTGESLILPADKQQ